MSLHSRFASRPIRALFATLAMTLAMTPAVAVAAQLTASWVDNTDGTATTRIERRRSTEPTFVALADVPPGTTSFVDASVSPATTYCYRAAAWVEDGVSPYTDEVCTTSAAEPLTVSVSKAGTGSGTVTTSPAGINCGATCTATYSAGTSVTFMATPAAGSTFSGWSGSGCAGTAPCVVAGNASLSVTATFALAPVTAPSPTLH